MLVVHQHILGVKYMPFTRSQSGSRWHQQVLKWGSLLSWRIIITICQGKALHLVYIHTRCKPDALYMGEGLATWILRTAPGCYFARRERRVGSGFLGALCLVLQGAVAQLQSWEQTEHFPCTELGEFYIFPQILLGFSLAGVLKFSLSVSISVIV